MEFCKSCELAGLLKIVFSVSGTKVLPCEIESFRVGNFPTSDVDTVDCLLPPDVRHSELESTQRQ